MTNNKSHVGWGIVGVGYCGVGYCRGIIQSTLQSSKNFNQIINLKLMLTIHTLKDATYTRILF